MNAFHIQDSRAKIPFLWRKMCMKRRCIGHRTEERHEYDFHIDALVRTISAIEPFIHKIMAMSPEERALFRVKPCGPPASMPRGG